MNSPTQLAKHFRDVYSGGNWTCVNLRDVLKDITWQQATTKVQSLNTIAILLGHTSYYIATITKVLQGGPLVGKDEESFVHPPIQSEEEWRQWVNTVLTDAENMAALIEQLPEEKLWEPFTDEKYGNYYRHLLGVTEHMHYHLGQMVLIRKLVQAENGQV
ncbi:MAG TPA: DUF1572 domain-containing protein [Bacteroidia bacterium]|nr:DUF1572 domain-containing protein [Bacteroidia bacterium]